MRGARGKREPSELSARRIMIIMAADFLFCDSRWRWIYKETRAETLSKTTSLPRVVQKKRVLGFDCRHLA
jgi:hypothetical protein